MPPEIAEVQRWLVKADGDRRMAEIGLAQAPPITDAAGFHAQQAVEKLLKAYLVLQDVEFEKIHDLVTLTERCAERDPSFAALREQVAPLTAFAVRFRYPGPADPTFEQVERALSVVESVREFVLTRLPPEARP